MPLTTSLEMLNRARHGSYAVGAFNIENMEMAQAVIQAAEKLYAPVIVQTTSSTLKYATPEIFFGLVSALANAAHIPVVLQLDHGANFGLCKACVEAGYTSVMIDGSHEAFEENLRITKAVADLCRQYHIPVEAELGKVGGKEDDLQAEAEANTDPKQAVYFVKAAGVQSLAVAIGTAHGLYVNKPVLDKQRLREISAVVDVPLVLHGASGLCDEDVRECIQRGICKVNFATELRAAYTDGIKAILKQRPEIYDPKALGEEGKKRVTELVMNRIRVCGCEGKAEAFI